MRRNTAASTILFTRPLPGFSYSNLGYVLVGRLIEVLTGTSWPAAVASLLLEPLGIEPSFIQPAVPGAPPRAVATGHSVTANPERTRPVQQSLAAAEAPAGALAVSAKDLLELGMLHLPPGSPWLLPPEQAQLMREPVPEADRSGSSSGLVLGAVGLAELVAGLPAGALVGRWNPNGSCWPARPPRRWRQPARSPSCCSTW